MEGEEKRTEKFTSSTVADDDELEAWVIHDLLIRQRLREGRGKKPTNQKHARIDEAA